MPTLGEMIRRESEIENGCLIVRPGPGALRLRQAARVYLQTEGFTDLPEPLETLHERVRPCHQRTRADSPFNDTFARVDRHEGLLREYERAVEFVSSICFSGAEIVFERAPLLRFHYPVSLPACFKQTDGVHLTHHSDTLFGDPFEQFNIWIGVAGCRGSATLQLASLEVSIEVLEQFARSINFDWARYRDARSEFFEFLRENDEIRRYLLASCRPLDLADGDVVVFDPRMIHATAENCESMTRVSLDFRVIRLAQYDEWSAWLRSERLDPGRFGTQAFQRGAYYDGRTSVALSKPPAPRQHA